MGRPFSQVIPAWAFPQGEGQASPSLLETDGQVCPFPLVEANQAMQQIPSGDELVIDFDCTQATDSLPRWAAENGHEVTDFVKRGAAEWTITVKKG